MLCEKIGEVDDNDDNDDDDDSELLLNNFNM